MQDEGRIEAKNSKVNILLEEDGSFESVGVAGKITIAASGAIELSNNIGRIQITSSGVVIINGVSITPDGLIVGAQDVRTTAAISLTDHKHIGNLGQPTSPSIP